MFCGQEGGQFALGRECLDARTLADFGVFLGTYGCPACGGRIARFGCEGGRTIGVGRGPIYGRIDAAYLGRHTATLGENLAHVPGGVWQRCDHRQTADWKRKVLDLVGRMIVTGEFNALGGAVEHEQGNAADSRHDAQDFGRSCQQQKGRQGDGCNVERYSLGIFAVLTCYFPVCCGDRSVYRLTHGKVGLPLLYLHLSLDGHLPPEPAFYALAKSLRRWSGWDWRRAHAVGDDLSVPVDVETGLA